MECTSQYGESCRALITVLSRLQACQLYCCIGVSIGRHSIWLPFRSAPEVHALFRVMFAYHRQTPGQGLCAVQVSGEAWKPLAPQNPAESLSPNKPYSFGPTPLSPQTLSRRKYAPDLYQKAMTMNRRDRFKMRCGLPGSIVCGISFTRDYK